MPWISLLGIGFMLASIAVYGTIKPTLKAPKTSKRVRKMKAKQNGEANEDNEPTVHWESVGSNSSLGENSPLLPQFADDAELSAVPLVRHESLHEALVHPELPNFGPYMMPNELGVHVELENADAEKTRKAFGMAVALLVGAFLSCCLVPFVNWKERCQPSDPALSSPIVETCNPLNFVFSQCLGVYLTSTIVFLLYSLFHRFVLKRSMPRSVMRPAYICGMLWGIGLCGQLYAIGALGFDQIFPICSIGPAMVSMLWSAGYFKEIQGKKNLQSLAVANKVNEPSKSEKHSWKLSLSRKSIMRVHSPFSLHTRVAHVLEEEDQDAFDPKSKAIKIWDHVVLLTLLFEAFLVPYFMAFDDEAVETAFDPKSKAIKIWDHVVILTLLFEAFLVPYFMAFDDEAVETVSTLFVLVVVAEGVFAIDFYIQAHTGYYADGNLIRDKKLTIRRYVNSFQFMLDVVAILPYQALVVAYPEMVAKLLLLKLIRWSRLSHFISSLDEFYAKYFVLLKLMKVLVSTVYLAHVQACVRFSFAHTYSDESEQSTHSLPLHEQYLASLFWSIGIMTGLFEGELPHHSSEFLFTIVVALCGFSMFTTLVATIFVISKCESGRTEALEARINQLVHVLSFHRVPESQQVQAIEYLKLYYTDTESHDRETAKILCPSIANDIKVELLKSTIAQISIFEGCNDQFIVAMTSLLEMIALPAQTTLFSTGDDGDAMYVVHSGVLSIVINSVMVREIRKGSCFGELSVFASMPRTATVITATYVILYKLSKFHCERVLEGYPECASLVTRHVQDILNQLNDSEKSVNSNASSSSSVVERTDIRRASVAAGVVAGASALARVLSQRRKLDMSSSRRSIVLWLGRRGSVTPTPQDIDVKFEHGSKRHLSPPKIKDVFRSRRTRSDEEALNKVPVNPYDRHDGPKAAHIHDHHALWRLLLLRKCIDHHSRTRRRWLLLLLLNLCYCWLVIPVQVTFPLWQRPGWLIQALDTISNFGLLLDILLNFSLSFTTDKENILDPKRSAKRYLTSSFIFDLLCALPYEYFQMTRYGLMRLPRLLRVLHLRNHLSEIAYFVPFNSKHQLILLGTFLLMMFHVVTCIHFGISYFEGFNRHEEEAWISPVTLCLNRINATSLENCDGMVFDEDTDFSKLQGITFSEYSRSLYYAVGVLASPGKSVEPASVVQLIAAVVLMLSGFLITAIVVDNVQKRFTASAFEQKEFFATSTRIQHFLRRQNAPLVIHHRVKSFLDYWWSSHRGAVIGELLADLPRPIRLDLLKSICLPVVQTLALLPSVRPVQDSLEEIMVENAKFILYGQGEIVYRHGDSVMGMFFLLEGEVCMVEKGESSREVPRGAFFGTAALTQQDRGEGYTEHVSANSGCILLLVSRDQIQAMEAICPTLKEEFLALEQRLLGNKLSSMRAQRSSLTLKENRSRMLHLLSGVKESFVAVHDPDSFFVLAWETWVFVVMTIQWTLVMFHACYPMQGGHRNGDALMVFLEISFVVDIWIRSRLGFYEFGNKIMDPVRIKRKYRRSGTFVLDFAALLPLYAINWIVPARERWDLLNINKLLRLVKVPKQLYALETRYLKHTTELRLFKLLYYTFLLAHFFGCIWFNFASRVAVPSFIGVESKETAFGGNHWLPSEHLEHGSHILQYMASLYWSFGLMSASSEPEFPKTTSQCLFSAITMTTGFFLFAYVIGNFTDIIELKSSETREFNAKMRSIRKLLDHFQMSESLQQRVKTFLLFKRYHSITQEGLLVHCLPPSLLTDIRLVHLKPMIEKVEFLRGMEGSITRMLVSQFTQVLISRGEFICKYGESGSDMFFIFAGVLDILVPSRIANRNCSSFKSVVRNVVAIAGKGVGPANVTKAQDLVKVNEISAGRYFGENGLFTNGKRNAFVQAQTSCILYRLSRESMELVFSRYPKWKQKVLRIANIRREQERLMQLSRDEQQRGMATITGLMLSRADVMNERAERLKEELDHARLKRRDSERISFNLAITHTANRLVLKPSATILDGLIHGVPVQSKFHLIWLRFMVICTMYHREELDHARLKRRDSERISFFNLAITHTVNRLVLKPSAKILDGLIHGVPVQSKFHLIWLRFMVFCTMYFSFILDVWFSWHVQESPTSLELYEQNLRSVYKKQRMLFDVIAAIPFYGLFVEYEQNLRSVYKKQRMLFDVIAAIPFYGLLFVFKCRRWVNLLRCVKIVNVMGYLDEIHRRNLANELTRFWHVWMMYLLVIHWAACSYLAVATEVGFGTEWESWLPSQELEIADPLNPSSSQLSRRFLRGLFFATTAFVKKARNIAPDTASLESIIITTFSTLSARTVLRNNSVCQESSQYCS
ncbi:hypothetical protein PHMEG_00017980 [Phytophthora megakarya]|uniref:Cyclic nucleotide-binding domain-containing protein n=1 Tax=Phytophthora megakarya TaxID=4795 RepID=A0A225VVF7_9STRA|nr:hypothetical protein PHMEG_00017980 [Phytophthora megakarya]